MGNQPGRNGESQEGKPERRHGGSHCEAEAGRTERKNIRLSNRKGSGSGRKEAEAERKMPEKKGTKGTGGEGKHSWNSCGSEARKGERKRTGELSTGTGKECTGNQAGKNGEDVRSESGRRALRKPL